MARKLFLSTPRGDLIQNVSKNGSVKARIEWNDAYFDRQNKNYNRAQMFVDSQVLRLSDPYIPFASGTLIKSGILATDVGSGVVQWNTPYAAKQYYENKGNNPNGPMRGAYWFERMKANHKDKILQGAASIMRR